VALNPRTVNLGIIVPLTGADVDLWGENDVNPNMVTLDGLLAGVQTITLAGGAVTLTSPAGFNPTPTPGPTESQNAVLRFTGVIASDATVTLPLPGKYVVENVTTGAFKVILRGATLTEQVALPPGEIVEVYNDGARVRFIGMGRVGHLEFWAGLITMPAWVGGCTVPPYLSCDASLPTYSTSSFPFLGNIMGSNFGGNGVSTFGVPDLRGRYPLAYDGTGTRVTTAGCGLNGQTMGAVLDAQQVVLNTNQMPSHFHSAGISDPTHAHSYLYPGNTGNTGGGGPFGNSAQGNITNAAATGVRVTSSNGLDTTYSAGGGLGHPNMPNTQVAGIWVIKT
jgi:microcystin-dependent protein